MGGGSCGSIIHDNTNTNIGWEDGLVLLCRMGRRFRFVSEVEVFLLLLGGGSSSSRSSFVHVHSFIQER